MTIFCSLSADDGIGMEPEQVAALLQNEPSDRTGIGVKNVNDRLRIYFGAGYGISIDSAPDEGTTVTIRTAAACRRTGRATMTKHVKTLCCLSGPGRCCWQAVRHRPAPATAPRPATRSRMIAKIHQDSEFWSAVFTGAEAAATEYNMDLTITGPRRVRRTMRPRTT